MLNAVQRPEAVQHLDGHLISLGQVAAKSEDSVGPIRDGIKG